jgi:hypothetical protein
MAIKLYLILKELVRSSIVRMLQKDIEKRINLFYNIK